MAKYLAFAFALCCAAACPAQAALEEVAAFGDSSSRQLAHPCQRAGDQCVARAGGPRAARLTKTSTYADNAGFVAQAEAHGFIVVAGETRSANNANKCFNWFEGADIDRDAGEAQSLKSMIDNVKANYNVDDNRVFVAGLSAGAAMAAVMLSVYPDVFAGGAIHAPVCLTAVARPCCPGSPACRRAVPTMQRRGPATSPTRPTTLDRGRACKSSLVRSTRPSRLCHQPRNAMGCGAW